MVMVTDTLAHSGLVGAILDRFLIVAVAVQELQVEPSLIAAKASGDDMVCF